MLTKFRARVLLESNHAHMKGRLITVELVPLIRRQGAAVRSVVVVGNAVQNDDAAIVAIGGGRVQDGQRSAGLRNECLGPRDPIRVQAKACFCDISVVGGDDESRGGDGSSGGYKTNSNPQKRKAAR